MRILHLTTRLILGGSQENTVLSCEGQTRPPLEHEVHLAFGPIYGPEGSLLERIERFNAGEALDEGDRGDPTSAGKTPAPPVQIRSARHAIRTHIIPNLVREINPLADAQAFKEIRALIEQVKPDIVHTHSSKAGILGRLAAWRVLTSCRRASVPSSLPPAIVHTIHGPPFMPVEGSLPKRAIIAAKNKIYELVERRAARHCHVIVSVADAMTQQFLARGIGTPDQYVTVYSGMDVEPYLNPAPSESRDQVRATLGLAPGDFVIGTVARLAEHKGHDDLLDALGEDLRSNPNWKLLWVGDGWWRDRLLARVRGLGLEHRVVLTGLVPPERVPGLMRAMDVLVHPSYREGLPRTVPQASLAGVPTIAYDCDGTSEACIDGKTGRLVPVGDRIALRKAVGRMYDHPHERAAMGERGRALCRDRFSTEAMLAALERVYARAIGDARRSISDRAGCGPGGWPGGDRPD
jgi:glycosyltransferase involved in cell wall biosynthesis